MIASDREAVFILVMAALAILAIAAAFRWLARKSAKIFTSRADEPEPPPVAEWRIEAAEMAAARIRTATLQALADPAVNEPTVRIPAARPPHPAWPPMAASNVQRRRAEPAPPVPPFADDAPSPLFAELREQFRILDPEFHTETTRAIRRRR